MVGISPNYVMPCCVAGAVGLCWFLVNIKVCRVTLCCFITLVFVFICILLALGAHLIAQCYFMLFCYFFIVLICILLVIDTHLTVLSYFVVF